MELCDQIIECFNDIGYSSASIESAEKLKEVVDNDLVEYSKFIAYLTLQLSKLCGLDEHVNAIESKADEQTFILELCAFLKEVSCPYKVLTDGPLDQRFNSLQNKLFLLNFLISELQAARMLASNQPESQRTTTTNKSDESEESKALKTILMTLGFSKPPANTSATEIWTKVEGRCKDLLSHLPANYLGNSLLNSELTQEQWEKLNHINQALCSDFQMRRELLLTRLDVTIQSFKWADRLKQSNTEISNLYQKKRAELSVKQPIKLANILSARDDLCKQEKTCSTRLMTPSQLHKIIIPKVPDRGGRTTELEPPPPEMPAFMQRRPQPQRQQQQQQHHHQGNRNQNWRGGHQKNFNNQWSNDGQNFRKMDDFEKFENQDYHNNTNRNGNNGQYRGGAGGGGYRGGRSNNRY